MNKPDREIEAQTKKLLSEANIVYLPTADESNTNLLNNSI